MMRPRWSSGAWLFRSDHPGAELFAGPDAGTLADEERAFWAGAAAWLAARFAAFLPPQGAASCAAVAALAVYFASRRARAPERTNAPPGASRVALRAVLFCWAAYRGIGAALGPGPATEGWSWLAAAALFAGSSGALVVLWRLRPTAVATRAVTCALAGSLALLAASRASGAAHALAGALGCALLLSGITAPLDAAPGERAGRSSRARRSLPWCATLALAAALLWRDQPFAALLVSSVGLVVAPEIMLSARFSAGLRGDVLRAFLFSLALGAPYAFARGACCLDPRPLAGFSAAIWCR